jgi:hypothetical protein
MMDMSAVVNQIEEFDDDFPQAEAVLPVQFHGVRRGTVAGEPLGRLMIAMLVDAIRSFQTGFEACQPAHPEEFSEARSWIFSDDDNGFFSFRAVCDALELDPRALRTGLVRWERRKFLERRPCRSRVGQYHQAPSAFRDNSLAWESHAPR